jgi:ABC-type lipoprotein export system ATPase subunit
LLLLTLFGGFIVAPDAIPDWIAFFYWWNPLAWAFRALVLNEFFSGRYDDPEAILEQLGFINPNGQVYDERWIGLGFVYMIPYAVLCTIGAGFGLHTFKPAGMPSVPRFALDPASEELVGTLEIPFTPVDLSFENVCYDVRASTSNEQLRLLHSIGGIFRHGRLTALMGSSGAGKSTLLDVLAMRKTSGTVGGEVRLNGWLQEQSSFRRCAGYVEVSIPHEFMIAFRSTVQSSHNNCLYICWSLIGLGILILKQFDFQQPELTVRETVDFSARLRLEPDSVDFDQLVDSVIRQVELSPYAHTLVGKDGGDGLSFEQRKRLSIAVELAASPSIIFLDEVRDLWWR